MRGLLERLEAAVKPLRWVDRFAHNPPFEESDAISEAMIETVTHRQSQSARAPRPETLFYRQGARRKGC